MSTEPENSGSQTRPNVPGDPAARNALAAALPGRPDQNQHAHFSARVIFRALGRRWRLALGLGLLLGTGAALGMAFGRPVTYTAYALLQVASTDNKILPTTGGGDDNSKTYQKTQVALIKNRSMLLASLRDNKARQVSFLQNVPDPAAWLEGELQVSFIEGTDLLRIALTEAKPQEIADVVNAVKTAYLEENTKKERSDKLTRLSQLETLCSKMDEKLLRQRENVRKLGQLLGTSDPAALTLKQKQAIEEWGTLKKELQVIQKRKRDLATRVFIEKQRLKTAENASLPAAQIEQELERDIKFQEALKEAQKNKEDAEKIRDGYEKGNPKYSLAQKKLDEAKAKYDALRPAAQKAAIELARKPLVQKLLAALADAEEELAVTTELEKAVDQGVRELSQIAGHIGTTSLELEMKKNEIEQADATIRQLRTEKDRLDVEVQGNQQRVSLVMSAEAPLQPNTGVRVQSAMSAGLAIFLLVLVAVTYWEIRSRWVSGSEEIVQELGMRVLGSLPAMPNQSSRKRRAAGQGEWDRRLVESVDAIRAMILCDEGMCQHQVIVISSAKSREGKTTLASHLATSVARTARRTLLIDGDLRRPAVHHLFDLPGRPGLSELILGEVDFADAVVEGPAANLWLLQAGLRSRQAIAALAQGRIGNILAKARQQFDYVIIDSSPILPVADALILAKQADGVLLSVKPFTSQIPSVFAAFEKLNSLGISVLGAVVTGSLASRQDYDYEYVMQGPDLEYAKGTS